MRRPSLEDEHAAALGSDHAVRVRREGLDVPVLATALMVSKPIVAAGVRIMLTPPATAASDSPERRLCTAWWTDTSDDEHAVSTAIDGLGSRRSTTRFAMIEVEVPVSA